MPRPQAGEYAPFYQRYIDNTKTDHVLEELQNSVVPMQDFLGKILDEKAGHRYAPGKWTVKQVIQHMIDAERVFAYRAMCIARGDTQSLPGFEENEYAANATAENRSLQGLISELMLMRQASIFLFRHLNETELRQKGIANNDTITPNSIGFILVGHAVHHMNVLKERYL